MQQVGPAKAGAFAGKPIMPCSVPGPPGSKKGLVKCLGGTSEDAKGWWRFSMKQSWMICGNNEVECEGQKICWVMFHLPGNYIKWTNDVFCDSE